MQAKAGLEAAWRQGDRFLDMFLPYEFGPTPPIRLGSPNCTEIHLRGPCLLLKTSFLTLRFPSPPPPPAPPPRVSQALIPWGIQSPFTGGSYRFRAEQNPSGERPSSSQSQESKSGAGRQQTGEGTSHGLGMRLLDSEQNLEQVWN